VAKFPGPAEVGAIRDTPRAVKALVKGTLLARVYFTASGYPTRWNEFRRYGPTNARFDHHLPDSDGAEQVQKRSVLYAATSAVTCLAEVFQETRRIDRVRAAPWLAIFPLERTVQLLDLTGAYATRVGASMAINTGPRARAREWAQRCYEAYEDLHGIYYAASMHANEPAIALNDRAEQAEVLPRHPSFNRALADDALLSVLKHGAAVLGYGLR
jgi:RES domain